MGSTTSAVVHTFGLHDAIDEVRRDGRQRRARCPAHDDRRASLSIGLGDEGRLLLRCHAGCTFAAVLAAAGLQQRDVGPEADGSKTESQIVATYQYFDEFGTHLFDVVRFWPKAFRQRNARGEWSLTGVRRVLYRLPELQNQLVVYVAEGEKDVDNLRRIGLTATCNPGGAGKWRNDYAELLVNAGVRHVDVLPDNDETGRMHAREVAASCHAAGLEVKVVELPGLPLKGDVSDWMEAGHTKADLLELVNATSVYVPDATTTERTTLALTSIGDLLAEPDESIDWLVDGRIPTGSVVICAAKPKVGKSTLARDLALAVARGESWLGHTCAAGMVWLFAFEGRRRDARAHFRQMGATAADALRVFVGQAPQDVVNQVRRLAEKERPALIIIDTMQRFLRAQSTDDYAEMTSLLDAVIATAQTSGATMMLLHHSGKADRASIDAVLGSTAITGSADTIILLTRNERYRTIATVQRVGDDLEETVIYLDPTTGRVRLGARRRDADEDLVGDAILSALEKANAPVTEAEIERLVDARTSLKRRALRQLVAREQVFRSGKGGKGSPYRYAHARSHSLVPSNKGEQANTNSDLSIPPTEQGPILVPRFPNGMSVPAVPTRDMSSKVRRSPRAHD